MVGGVFYFISTQLQLWLFCCWVVVVVRLWQFKPFYWQSIQKLLFWIYRKKIVLTSLIETPLATLLCIYQRNSFIWLPEISQQERKNIFKAAFLYMYTRKRWSYQVWCIFYKPEVVRQNQSQKLTTFKSQCPTTPPYQKRLFFVCLCGGLVTAPLLSHSSKIKVVSICTKFPKSFWIYPQPQK